jgi:hypothetical protein
MDSDFGMSPAFYPCDMNMLLTFFSSLAEPTRLALMGSTLIVGALLLRKLVIPGQHSLNGSAKADAQAK